MGKQFLDDLVKQNCGIFKENDQYLLEREEIEEPISPPGLELHNWTVDYLKNEGILGRVRLKSCVTGPFTLASYVKTGSGAFPFNSAVSDLDKVRQLATVISKSCGVLAEEAHMVSVDEPILSVIVGRRIFFRYDERDIAEIYNDLKRSCGGRLTGTHVCGRISPRLAEILLCTDLDFLSHEFHDTADNFRVYDPNKLKESEKILSVGCVSSWNPNVETVDEILKTMKKAREYGDDLIFTPDCGFKKLRADGPEAGYEVAKAKLRNLVESASRLRRGA